MPADDPLRDFLQSLLFEGRARLRLPLEPDRTASPEALAILERAHRLRSLDLAGPPIPFDPAVASAAAIVVRTASVALVERGEETEPIANRLAMPLIPSAPAHHLAADLTFRFVPDVLRRARVIDAADPLVGALTELLRAWPLSGVLGDVSEPPTVAPAFSGHHGLMMLYAERLVRRDRPGWYPGGVAGEYVDLARSLSARDHATHALRDRR